MMSIPDGPLALPAAPLLLLLSTWFAASLACLTDRRAALCKLAEVRADTGPRPHSPHHPAPPP